MVFIIKNSNVFLITKTTIKYQRVTILASVIKKLVIYVIGCMWMSREAHKSQ